MKSALLAGLAIVAAGFATVWARAVRRTHTLVRAPTWLESAIGFGTNFFDTLGSLSATE